MAVLKIALCVFIFTVSALRIFFSATGIRLNKSKNPFMVIHILTAVISGIRMTQYVYLYSMGHLPVADFDTLFVSEIGTYGLSILSLASYIIKRNIAKMTGDMYDKCEVCYGDLYAHGVPHIIKNRHICAACIQTINEAKLKK
ncbi:MAG: hypothetical protein ACYSYL_21900 [Planctomycetota bacterium]|jgi:hypothetical protein